MIRDVRAVDESPVTNEDVAGALADVADLLEVQEANPYRVRAYRDASRTIAAFRRPVSAILARDGLDGLEELPGIGVALARAVQELVETGRLGLLDRLHGEICPEDRFRTVPGIGPELARRIHEELGIETLEDLEVAAHDGRLEGVRGFGSRRVRGVREALAGMLGRSARRRSLAWKGRRGLHDEGRTAASSRREAEVDAVPSVDLLLEVDGEYRRKAEADQLPRIAPRRFNPTGRAWLPILHTDREGWHLTALYSNTARAHDLGRTHDWVVIYADGAGGGERRFTVVTEYRGELAGKRVVRGREGECRTYYGGRAGSQRAGSRGSLEWTAS